MKASQPGPAYDLPTVMTKMLHLGMSLKDVIARTTIIPARVYGLQDQIGSLSLGFDADITVLDVVPVKVALEDVHGQTRVISQRIVPVAVFRAGEVFFKGIFFAANTRPSFLLVESLSFTW